MLEIENHNFRQQKFLRFKSLMIVNHAEMIEEEEETALQHRAHTRTYSLTVYINGNELAFTVRR